MRRLAWLLALIVVFASPAAVLAWFPHGGNRGVAPTVSNVAISGNVIAGNPLTASATITGSPPPTVSYQWIDSVLGNVGTNSQTYTAVASDVGNTLTVNVAAVNASGSANATSPAFGPIQGGNIPPGVSNLVVSGSTTVGNVLTASATIIGAPTPTLSYQWQSNGVNVGTNSSTYTTVSGDVSHTITVTETATNIAGTANETSSAYGPINSVPTIANAVISGNTLVGSQLTASATITGYPSPSITYQWKSAASNVGSNASTYTTVNSDVGNTITVAMTVSNVAGSNNATSGAFGPVTAASGPSVSNVAISGSNIAGNTLTVSATVSGSPTPTVSYQWQSAGANVGTNSSQYVTGNSDVNNTITATVTASNTGGTTSGTSPAFGPILSSGSSAPTVGSVNIVGNNAVGSTLSMQASVAGNPAPTLTYAWYNSTETQNYTPIATTPSYTVQSSDQDMYIFGKVTATNSLGSAYGVSNFFGLVPPTPSGSATTINTPTISGSTTMGQVLTAAVTTGGSPSPAATTYIWYSNGTWVGSNTSMYQTTASDVGHTITVVASAWNDIGTPVTATSASFGPVVAPTPAITNVVLTHYAVTTGQSGAAVGTFVPTLNYGSWTGGISFSTGCSNGGTGNGSFTLNGANLVAQGAPAAGNYNVCVAVTQSGATTVTQGFVVSSVPQPTVGSMQAVVAMAGTNYTYSTNGGTNQTVVDMGLFHDDMGPKLGLGSRFSIHTIRVKNSTLPNMEVDFQWMAVNGSNVWGDVIFHYGIAVIGGAPNGGSVYSVVNGPQYTVTITGDYNSGGAINVPIAGYYSEWRWQSGQWPLAPLSVSSLVALHLLPQLDGAIDAGSSGAPSGGAAYTYQPMNYAGVGLLPGSGATGPQPEIGPLTDWQAWYVLCNSPNPPASWCSTSQIATAYQDILAQSEAMHAQQMFWRDEDTGKDVNVITQYPNASAAGGSFYLPQVPTNGFFNVQITGPPGTVLQGNQNAVIMTDTNLYSWIASNQAPIPASGSIQITVAECCANNTDPTGHPLALALGSPCPTCTVAYVPGTFLGAVGINIDQAHNPDLSYVPYVLTGDPWDLQGVQANAICSAACGDSNNATVPQNLPYSTGQPRGMAWGLRNIMHAAAVSPLQSNPLILDASVFSTELAVELTGLKTVMNGTCGLCYFGITPQRSVWYNLQTNGLGDRFVDVCNLQGQQFISNWQDAYQTIVAGWTATLFPQFQPVLASLASDLLSTGSPPTSGNYSANGWCPAYPSNYCYKVRDCINCNDSNLTTDQMTYGPLYSSWRMMYLTQTWTNHNAPGTCPTAASILLTAASWDYWNSYLAGLASIRQAAVAGVPGIPDATSTASYWWTQISTNRFAISTSTSGGEWKFDWHLP